MWIVLSALSALFAGLTAVLGKCGVQHINSHLATALRTVVVLLMAWGMVFVVGSADTIADITPRTWLFLIVSGLCTGLSWIFYFRALQLGDVNRVAPIDKSSAVLSVIFAMVFLHEPVSFLKVCGLVLMALGTILMLPVRSKAAQRHTDGGAWFVYAVLSAVFAALTAIFGRVGMQAVEPNLGTALRTGVVLLLSWGIVFCTGAQKGLPDLDKKSGIFLVLSGLSTGASWLCYYGALHHPQARVSVVVPMDKLSILVTVLCSRLLLGETLSARGRWGLLMLAAGTLLML